MPVTTVFDTLRGEFMRHRRGVSLDILVPQIEADRRTLKRFVDGYDVSFEVLRKIERWCIAQREQEQARVGGYGVRLAEHASPAGLSTLDTLA